MRNYLRFGLFVLLIIWVLAAAVGLSTAYRWQLYDESYIALRYARNLLNGEGLVFNPSERVEAFGSLLWVLLCTVFQFLESISRLTAVGLARSFTIILALGNVSLLYALSRKFISNLWLALLPAALMAADNVFLVNAVMGMEDQLLLFLLLSALLVPRSWLRGVIFCAIALTRFSAVIFILPFWAVSFKNAGQKNEEVRQLSVEAGIFLLFVIPLILWHQYYFGSFLPPASGAWHPPGNGLSYLHRFLSCELYLPVLILASFAVMPKRFAVQLVSIALLDIIYVLFVGGGSDSFSRLLLPLVPVSHLVTGVMIAWIWESFLQTAPSPALSSATFLTIAAVVVFGAYGMRNGPYHSEIRHKAGLQDARAHLGRWLGKTGRTEDRILLKDLGAIGYYSKLYVIDTEGRLEERKRKERRLNQGLDPKAALAKGPTIVPWGIYKKRVIDWRPFGFFLEPVFPEELRRFRKELGPGIWLKDRRPPSPLEGSPVFDFEVQGARGWKAVTESGVSEPAPAAGTLPHQLPVTLFHGKHYLSTFDPERGDKVKMKLVSPSFTLSGRRLCFLVAGGDDIKRLTVNLVIGGISVKRATGVRSETFGRRCWKIKEWRGREARIEVVDNSTRNWGHIMVDFIFQSR